MVRLITQITGAIKYTHSEVGYVDSIRSNMEELKGKRAEQMEIEFQPTPVIDTGDYLVLARWLNRNVAYRYSCVATFAPKLEEGITSNGYHVNVELRKNGINCMTDPNGELSRQAKQMKENDENMNEILADLPADDRLLETRKIMHKNIHRH